MFFILFFVIVSSEDDIYMLPVSRRVAGVLVRARTWSHCHVPPAVATSSVRGLASFGKKGPPFGKQGALAETDSGVVVPRFGKLEEMTNHTPIDTDIDVSDAEKCRIESYGKGGFTVNGIRLRGVCVCVCGW